MLLAYQKTRTKKKKKKYICYQKLQNQTKLDKDRQKNELWYETILKCSCYTPLSKYLIFRQDINQSFA